MEAGRLIIAPHYNMYNFIGWGGFACMQCLTLPAIYNALQGGESMPLLSIILGFVGLSLLSLKAIKDRQALYIALNCSGAACYLILLILKSF